ncbi:MAG: hypothetical protein HY606_01875 [Planctomycetes bacterium]|nr:hypothetical protein [Planctomycetota bacterium]
MKEYDQISEMIKHENELINHRLAWLGTFQGLLFAALAFAWNNADGSFLLCILCLLGIFISISVGLSTIGANTAINYLEQEWDKIKPSDYKGIDIVGMRNRQCCLWRFMPGYFIPWIFVGAWILLFGYLVLKVAIYWIYKNQ